MTTKDYNYDIIVEALDKSFRLEEFDLDKIDPLLFKWELGGITDPIGQLAAWIVDTLSSAITSLGAEIWGWLTTIRDGIINSISSALTTVKDALSGAISSVGNAVTSISASLSSFITYVEGAFSTVQTAISQIGVTISGIVTSIQTAIGEVITKVGEIVGAIQNIGSTIVNQLSSLGTSIYQNIASFSQTITSTFETAFTGLTEFLSGAINTIVQGLSNLGSQLMSAISSIPSVFQTAFTGLTEWLQQAFTAVTASIAGFEVTLTTFAKQVLGAFNVIGTALSDTVNQIVAGVTQAWQKVRGFLEKQYEKLVNSLKDVGIALSGFINPLVGIKNWLETQFGVIISFFEDVKQGFIDFITSTPKKITELVDWIKGVPEQVRKAIEPITTFFSDVKDKAVAFFEKTGTFFVDMPGFFEGAKDRLLQLGNTIWVEIQQIGQKILEGVTSLTAWIRNTFEVAINTVMGTLEGIIESGIASPLKVISERIKKLPAGMGEIDIASYIAMGYSVEAAKQFVAAAAVEAAGEAAGDQEVSVEPLGLGAKIRLKLGSFLKTAAKYIRKIVLDSLKFSFLALTFWVVEPVRYYVYQHLRNVLPVQLPTIHEMIEYTRRRMPTTVFNDWIKKSREVMALRGFNDDFINAVFTKVDELPSELQIKVRDRFGVERLLPTSAVYDLPTSTDFCRMMVRDIISLDGFKKAMLARGMIPDIAKMYYLLHFKYPPLDKLFEFICRCAAGFAWVDVEPQKEEDLGVTGVKPTALNAVTTELGQEISLDTVKSKIVEYTSRFLTHYAKWHDYAPFAYINGFTADRLINLDMMADIPMRIDGRWMYKWGLINEYDVFRIATARGMHPRWLDLITIAECMNALAEERNLARTGVINAFKEGFSTESLLKQSLTKLTTIKILGRDVDVKFLDGETKLLTLRAKYDRALDILRDYHKDLIKGFVESIIKWDDVTKALKTTTEALSRGLGIRIAFDDEYYKLYQPVAKSLQSVYTIKRIRYWLRYMMRTILTRFERGYVSKSEIEKIVNEIVKFAKMTDEEKKAMLEVAEMLSTVFNREMIARGILRKLSRGVISVSEAKAKLKELGLEDNVIDAMIEYHAKTYTLTLSQLVSYMEYIPVSQEMLKRKMEMLGVPEDEAKLIPAYAIARVLSSEAGRLVTELITDYAKGLLTEQQLRQELDNIATLWGKVRDLGVEWVILSPQEREILMLLAKKRRERELARRRA